MVRLALRAALVARQLQLVEINAKGASAPLPPLGSSEEEAELIQGLLTVTPNWHQEMDWCVATIDVVLALCIIRCS